MSLLKIEDLYASIGDEKILNGLSLEINAGETHAIMGPNGSGKSTLSYVLSGREDYDVSKGSVLLDRKKIPTYGIPTFLSPGRRPFKQTKITKLINSTLY